MKKKEVSESIPPHIKTANEFFNVKDIKGNFLYTKDDYIFGYVRLYQFNLDLLSREERYIKTQALTSSFEADRKSFDYLSFPREIDLDDYKNSLKEKYKDELNNLGKRRILLIMMQTAQTLTTSGENYEHQQFIKIWQRIAGHEAEAKHDLYERLEEFKNRYISVGVQAEILDEQEIMKLCNLFGNSRQVSYENIESNLMYSNIPQIRG